MIACFDVYYADESARAAGVLFDNWKAASASAEYVVTVESIAAYVPGEFYRRELPCLLAIIEQISEPIELIVLDGYVTLGETARHGLGMYLFEALDEMVPIVGVAKTRFEGTGVSAEITRGSSQSPLYVTTVGIDLETAKRAVQSMHGEFRIPTLLKRVDQLSRGL